MYIASNFFRILGKSSCQENFKCRLTSSLDKVYMQGLIKLSLYPWSWSRDQRNLKQPFGLVLKPHAQVVKSTLWCNQTSLTGLNSWWTHAFQVNSWATSCFRIVSSVIAHTHKTVIFSMKLFTAWKKFLIVPSEEGGQKSVRVSQRTKPPTD